MALDIEGVQDGGVRRQNFCVEPMLLKRCMM